MGLMSQPKEGGLRTEIDGYTPLASVMWDKYEVLFFQCGKNYYIDTGGRDLLMFYTVDAGFDFFYRACASITNQRKETHHAY